MTKAGKKILVGAREAVAVAKGDPAAVMRTCVTPSCGCVFCDLKLDLFRDEHGFYHEGPEDTRIKCGADHE